MKKILLQLDPDPQASAFDAIVALDSGVDCLIPYSAVEPTHVRELVHGAIFTRGPKHLHNTAIFIGGRDVERGEQILAHVRQAFFGPLRVSVMLDANGANTTAAAAVMAASRHLTLADCTAVVLAGTGSVGTRVVRLLCREGAKVRVCSRSLDRAQQVVTSLVQQDCAAESQITAVAANAPAQLMNALDEVSLVISAGAAGVQLLSAEQIASCRARVLIDLNAVPPAGMEAVPPSDNATERGTAICYGAIGVGGLKMLIHKASIARLYSAKDLVLDLVEIFEMGREIAEQQWV